MQSMDVRSWFNCIYITDFNVLQLPSYNGRTSRSTHIKAGSKSDIWRLPDERAKMSWRTAFNNLSNKFQLKTANLLDELTRSMASTAEHLVNCFSGSMTVSSAQTLYIPCSIFIVSEWTSSTRLSRWHRASSAMLGGFMTCSSALPPADGCNCCWAGNRTATLRRSFADFCSIKLSANAEGFAVAAVKMVAPDGVWMIGDVTLPGWSVPVWKQCHYKL